MAHACHAQCADGFLLDNDIIISRSVSVRQACCLYCLFHVGRIVGRLKFHRHRLGWRLQAMLQFPGAGRSDSCSSLVRAGRTAATVPWCGPCCSSLVRAGRTAAIVPWCGPCCSSLVRAGRTGLRAHFHRAPVCGPDRRFLVLVGQTILLALSCDVSMGLTGVFWSW